MSLTDRVMVEFCVDDVEGALIAEQEGADRIELCSALSEGGITPSLGLVRTVLDRVSRIGVQVMIRPRGGDFIVSPLELDVMLADIAAIRALPARPDVLVPHLLHPEQPPEAACRRTHDVGARFDTPASRHDGHGARLGFVFGVLTTDRMIDRAAMAALKAACGPAQTTCHKAFDLIDDLPAALDDLAALGIERVLTSGGAPTAETGRTALAALVRRGGDRVAILAGGGVRAHNAYALVEATGVREIHLRAMQARPGRPPVTVREEVAAVLRAVAPS